MLHDVLLILNLLLCVLALVLAFRRHSSRFPALGLVGGLLFLSLTGYFLCPAPEPEDTRVYPPGIVGRQAALRLGLWAQTQLPPPRPKHPPIAWLSQTTGGRPVIARPIVPFRQTAATAHRREGIRRNFRHRFGWKDALATPFEPQALIVHSTESEAEAHAFEAFDRSTSAQYLGGIWTHFCVDQQGRIYQYGPINLISKGQSGLDDASVGVEIVGTASLWAVEGHQPRTGSIISRWRAGDTTQLEAVADLLQTLRQHYQIPLKRIYSHEELGHVRDRLGTYPDFEWLRRHIRDRVYLSLESTLSKDFKPEEHFSFLEPYDRQDPGRDVMGVLRQMIADRQ